MFRQYVGELAIEQGTERVPADGRYHVLERGVLRKSFRSLRGAVAYYISLKPSTAELLPPSEA